MPGGYSVAFHSADYHVSSPPRLLRVLGSHCRIPRNCQYVFEWMNRYWLFTQAENLSDYMGVEKVKPYENLDVPITGLRQKVPNSASLSDLVPRNYSANDLKEHEGTASSDFACDSITLNIPNIQLSAESSMWTVLGLSTCGGLI